MSYRLIRKRMAACFVAFASILAFIGLFAPAPQAYASSISALNRKGVILVSRDPWNQSSAFTAALGHSGIVYSTSQIVESVASGVKYGDNNWESVRNKMTAVSVYSTTAAQDAAAADWARARIGKPYNYDFYNMNTRNSFYCSQLIWAAYYDQYGVDLNTSAYDVFMYGARLSAIAPTELISSPDTFTIYSKG